MWRKFPPVVVSLSVWDLEVNTANEVRCFSMTHANFLVKSVHIDPPPPPPPPPSHPLHKAVKSSPLLSDFVAAHKLPPALLHSQMWSADFNLTCVLSHVQ